MKLKQDGTRVKPRTFEMIRQQITDLLSDKARAEVQPWPEQGECWNDFVIMAQREGVQAAVDLLNATTGDE